MWGELFGGQCSSCMLDGCALGCPTTRRRPATISPRLYTRCSLPAVVAELRYTLCMICYTCIAILTCTYVGCCGSVSGATWQTMAGKVRRQAAWWRQPTALLCRAPASPPP